VRAGTLLPDASVAPQANPRRIPFAPGSVDDSERRSTGRNGGSVRRHHCLVEGVIRLVPGDQKVQVPDDPLAVPFPGQDQDLFQVLPPPGGQRAVPDHLQHLGVGRAGDVLALEDPLVELRIQAAPAPRKRVEPVSLLRDQKVSDAQICEIYNWKTSDGIPEIWKVQEEIDRPGTHTGQDFIDQDNLWLNVDCHGEAQSDLHS